MGPTFKTQPPETVAEHAQEHPAPPDNAAARRMAAADTFRYIDLRETRECMSRVQHSVSDRRRHTLDESKRLFRELDEAERLGRAPEEIQEIAECLRLSLDEAETNRDVLNRVSDAASKRMHRALDETENLVTRRSSAAGVRASARTGLVRTGLRRGPERRSKAAATRHAAGTRRKAAASAPSSGDDGPVPPSAAESAAHSRLAHPPTARRGDLLQVGDYLSATLARQVSPSGRNALILGERA